MFERDEVLLDVFTTGIEGGINYWFRVDSYKWKDMGKDWFATGVVADEDDEVYRIDRKVIVRGIRRAYENRANIGDKYQRVAITDLQYGHWDDLDYDAITADIVVQYGLFNDLVYG